MQEDESSITKKRTRRKPLSLHPMTEEALRRVSGAGPDPEKQGKKSAGKKAKKDE